MALAALVTDKLLSCRDRCPLCVGRAVFAREFNVQLISPTISFSLAVRVYFSPTFLPWRNTAMRSENAMTSCSLWAIKITDRPCGVNCLTVAKSCLVSWGLSTAVGSSRTRIWLGDTGLLGSQCADVLLRTNHGLVKIKGDPKTAFFHKRIDFFACIFLGAPCKCQIFLCPM